MTHILITLASGIICAGWIIFAGLLIRTLLRVPRLERLTPAAPDCWPLVSVIMPARNEEASLAAAAASLAAQDYPGNLEIIIIDDRSTDRTAAVAAQMAQSHPRIRLLSITALPAGWLGKVHALDAGVRQARGEWLLFTDADIVFAPAALSRAAAYAIEKRADHLAILPGLCIRTFPMKALAEAFTALFLVAVRPLSFNAQRPGAFAGIGAFNLVRRTAFERTPGMDWLRMEIIDDMGLGLMLKKSGARQFFLTGFRVLAVTGIDSFASLAAAAGKYGATAPPTLVIIACALFLCAVSAPVWAALAGPAAWARALGFAVGAALCAVAAVTKRRGITRSFFPALALPAGILILCALAARATVRCVRSGIVDWRGTRYTASAVRSMQRVRVTTLFSRTAGKPRG